MADRTTSLWGGIAELVQQVRSGSTSAVELVERSLKQIEEHKDYAAVISVTAERARKRAQEIDAQIAAGTSVGRLAGVPFIAKDNMLTFGSETTAASNILRGFTAPYQSTAVERLEAEGAIVVAKANLDAFAHGSSTENSDFMITKNPHDPQRVPGGSSGGSAAAVILDLAPFALGTDTGGSIRLPAAFCGAVGLKPTYGLVSRSGVVAMASSTDVIGPITRTVDDAALVLDVMSGRDDLDSTTVERDEVTYVPDNTLELTGVKVGVVKEYMQEGVEGGVKKSIESAVEKLRQAGADVQEISLPSLRMALACYYIIMPAEVSSNLSRYDGQRYGFSATDAKNLEESYNLSRSIGFGREAKRRIMIGAYVLSSGYYDAYYKKAQQLRTKLIDEFTQAFEAVDVLVGPTAPNIAFELGEHQTDPLRMYLTDIMTVAANLVGVPAISIPAGKVQNMPVGLQMIMAQRQDRMLLAIAKKTEEIL